MIDLASRLLLTDAGVWSLAIFAILGWAGLLVACVILARARPALTLRDLSDSELVQGGERLRREERWARRAGQRMAIRTAVNNAVWRELSRRGLANADSGEFTPAGRAVPWGDRG